MLSFNRTLVLIVIIALIFSCKKEELKIEQEPDNFKIETDSLIDKNLLFSFFDNLENIDGWISSSGYISQNDSPQGSGTPTIYDNKIHLNIYKFFYTTLSKKIISNKDLSKTKKIELLGDIEYANVGSQGLNGGKGEIILSVGTEKFILNYTGQGGKGKLKVILTDSTIIVVNEPTLNISLDLDSHRIISHLPKTKNSGSIVTYKKENSLFKNSNELNISFGAGSGQAKHKKGWDSAWVMVSFRINNYAIKCYK